MKKISRLSLEHLSEQLQCLSDSEASSLIGGDAYFSPSGAYLGDFGSGDEIIIVTEEEFREIVNRGYSYSDRRTSGNYTGSTSSDAGRSKDSLTDEAKASIAMHYASNYGFSSVCIDESNAGTGAYVPSDGSYDGTLYVNFKHISTVSSFRSTLTHEKAHVELGHVRVTGALSPLERFQIEMEAYDYQINSTEYQNTSQAYRRDVANAYWRRANQSGFSIGLEEVYKLFRIDGW